MNPSIISQKLIALGYKPVPDFDNSYYMWMSPHARISFIFNYDTDIGYAYLAFNDLISNKKDLEYIKEAYMRMKEDANTLSKIGIKINDLQSI